MSWGGAIVLGGISLGAILWGVSNYSGVIVLGGISWGAIVQGKMFGYHLWSCILCAEYIMIQVKPKSVSEYLQDFSEELDDLGHLHMHFSCSFYDKIVSQTENILP